MNNRLIKYLLVVFALFLFVSCFNQTQFSLEIKIEGEGIVVPNSSMFPNNTLVLFDLHPEPGWSFHEWAGENAQDLHLNQDRWSLIMDGDKSLTAVFKENEDTGKFNLSITITGEGTVYPMSGQYETGTVVDIVVTPNTHWFFNHWEGFDSRSLVKIDDHSFSLEMNSDKSIKAVFKTAEYYISVHPLGEGQITRSPNKYRFKHGETVTLTAIPAEGWRFSHWQGAAYELNNPIELIVEDNITITAVFDELDEALYSLRIGFKGWGEVNINPKKRFYEDGEQVSLTANPMPGYVFLGWSGDITGTDTHAQLIMDSDKSVLVHFEEEITSYQLDCSTIGKGSIIIEPDQASYEKDTLVTLTAQTDEEPWQFVNWSGDAQGTSSTIIVKMDSDKEITANFQQPTFRLTALVVEGHSYLQLTSDDPENDPDDCSEQYVDYAVGTRVNINSNISGCWGIHHWIVDGEYFDDKNMYEVDLIMDQEHNVYLFLENLG